jgi:cytochrome b561
MVCVVVCVCRVGVRVYEQILQLYPDERLSKKSKQNAHLKIYLVFSTY